MRPRRRLNGGQGAQTVAGSSSSPAAQAPHDGEVGAFLLRPRAVQPDVALFAVDTVLRLADKELPMFEAAKESLLDDLSLTVAEGLRALAPPPP